MRNLHNDKKAVWRRAPIHGRGRHGRGRARAMRVRSKIWLVVNNKLVFGEGKSEIFKLIQKHSSINRAAKELRVSFRHAWSYVNEIEKRLGVLLVERTKGGKGGGGSRLTSYAMELMDRYDSLKNQVDNYANKKTKEVLAGWKNMKSLK